MVRRIVSARVSDETTAEDLVQETLVRVLAAAHRVEPGMLEPYAIATARNAAARAATGSSTTISRRVAASCPWHRVVRGALAVDGMA